MDRLLQYYVCLFIIIPVWGLAQITGFTDNFNDNILTGWEVSEEHQRTYTLTEADSVLTIDYHRTTDSWEWDNFNFTPPAEIDVTTNPLITLRIKSDIGTELTLKPVYANGADDWLPRSIPGDNTWHFYTFDLENYSGTTLQRIYFYLDGGSLTPASGQVTFDDFKIGDHAVSLFVFGLTATQADSHQINLQWQCNFPEQVDYFRIYRSQTSGFTCSEETFVNTTTIFSYEDEGLEINTTYYYKITAVDINGIESPPSDEASASTYVGGTIPVVFVKNVNLQTVGLYKKFEIEAGMQMVFFTNPYDPDQISLRAVFTSPSGKTWEIFGFYDNFQDRKQWKIRFSPNETGEWSYYLKVTNQDSTGYSDTYSFTAVPSSHHGWIRPSPVNPHYFSHDDGTSFYGVGAYYPWGVTNGSNGLQLLEDSGANLWGYWNINYGGEGNFIESLESGLGRYDQAKCGRIDQLIEWSESRGMKMMLAIWPHDLLTYNLPGWAAQWQNNPYNTIVDVTGFFGSEEAWSYQEKQYRYLIARWGYSRGLGIWEIINEINGTDAWAAGHQAEATAWVEKVHRYFTEHDPFQHPTTASVSGGIYWTEGYEKVDIPNVHLYETGWAQKFPGNPLRSSAWLYHNISRQLGDDFQKPGIMGEAGYTNTYGNFTVPGEDYTNLYHNALWASWAGGLSATPVWWEFGSRDIMSLAVMEQMRVFSGIVRRFDYANQILAPIEVIADNADAWALFGENSGFGWCREYFGEDLTGKNIRFTGLPDTSFAVIWINTWNGDTLREEFKVSIDGVLATKIPPANIILPDVAFFLEPIAEGDTPVRIELQTSHTKMLTGAGKIAEITALLKDVENRFCGSASDSIYFFHEGPGRLLGPSVIQAQNGMAVIEFQADSVPGTAQVIATAAGLQPDTIAIEITNKLIVDDFESYSSNLSLQSEWRIRIGSSAEVSLEQSQVGEGNQSMKMLYSIGNGSPLFAGIFRPLCDDYQGAQSLQIWLKPDASRHLLSVQLVEDGGRTWKYDYQMPAEQPHYLNVPLINFIPADGTSEEMNLSALQLIAFYILKGEGEYGTGEILFDELSFQFPSVVTLVDHPETGHIPEDFSLAQNYPNPFNQETIIRYFLPEKSKVTIKIYTLLGQYVETLVNADKIAGVHQIYWNPAHLASGIYFYQMTAGEYTGIRKCILIK